MSAKIMFYAAIFGSLALFVITAITCRSKVTGTKLTVAVGSISVFFAAWAGLIVFEKQTIGVEPIALFLWLSVFVFYFFGEKYVTGRGFFDRGFRADLGAAQAHGGSSYLTKALRVSRHLLIWPMVALVISILARGLTGGGWVTTISWFPGYLPS